jgi:hypothetical protein
MIGLVALGNQVAVFLAVTAFVHINEPFYRGLRGFLEKSRNFSGRVRRVAMRHSGGICST